MKQLKKGITPAEARKLLEQTQFDAVFFRAPEDIPDIHLFRYEGVEHIEKLNRDFYKVYDIDTKKKYLISHTSFATQMLKLKITKGEIFGATYLGMRKSNKGRSMHGWILRRFEQTVLFNEDEIPF